MQSPIPTISLIVLYILFVNLGPKFMKNRAPLEMKSVLFVFNAAIVVLYVYLCKEVREVLCTLQIEGPAHTWQSQVENEHYSTVCGLVISLECFIEITPDFLCPFMND